MRSIRKTLIALLSVSLTILLVSCSSAETPVAAMEAPILQVQGTRAMEYKTLDQLGEPASAVVLVTSTGKAFERALPPEHGGTVDSAPTQYVTMNVNQVISGSLDAGTIDVVSPGNDERTGESVLLPAGSYILFITPAMYAADEPAGGYAVVGGPAGLYVDVDGEYLRVDQESPQLPASVSVDGTNWPAIISTEAELLQQGPR